MHPNEQECILLYHLYKETFSFDDGGSIDDYFKRNFRPEYCYIVKDQGHITSMLCAHPHIMHLYGKQLPVRFISGVITRNEHRGKGWMKQIFENMIVDTQDNTSLYVLQAYQPEIYTSLGFSEHYFIKKAYWTKPASSYHLQKITSAAALSQCALAELQYANGWMDHDEAFYINQMAEATAQQQEILGHIQNQELRSFARLSISQDQVTIEELRAQTKYDQQSLLSQLRNRWTQVAYTEQCTEKDSDCMCNLMVRLGNKNLCTDILQREISTLDDIYKKDQPYTHYGWW